MNQDRTKTPTPIHPFADAMRRMKRDDQHVTRPARRTLQQMAPGFERQPVLVLHRPVMAAEDACPICAYWKCRCAAQSVAVTGVKAVAA